ncbi:hypothetical protein [Parashewanella spongiae]|uniref:hypothetical protein n=1 Tax=Parashewanella spongiae TaxID=342950 RepID=UPI0028A28891|nr:hypothetical protein [Parashewanella spongiae]
MTRTHRYTFFRNFPKVDDLSDPQIALFLEEHLNDMKRISPPEYVHALDLGSLKAKNVTFGHCGKIIY